RVVRVNSSDPADAHVLELGVVEDAVLRAFPAEARLLHAAERRDFRGNDSGVEPDDAVLERFGTAPRAPEITRVEICRKPELGVVRHAHRFLLRAEAEERRHGPEGLLARDEHVRSYIRDDRRFEERASERMALAAVSHPGTLRDRIRDVLFDLRERL